MSKEALPEKAVVFIAHQDDEERATAAISELQEQGADLAVVLWTNGGGGEINGVQHNNPALVANIRLEEFRKSMSFFGIRRFYFMNQEDGNLKVTNRLVHAAEKIILAERADTVLTTTEDSGESAHRDHLTSSEIVKAALEKPGPKQIVKFAAGIDMMETLRNPDYLIDATKYYYRIHRLLDYIYASQNDAVDKTFFDQSLRMRGALMAAVTGNHQIKFAEAQTRIEGFQPLPFAIRVSPSSNSNLVIAYRPPTYLEVARNLRASA